MEIVRDYPLPHKLDTSHPTCPLCASELEVDVHVETQIRYYDCSYCDYYYSRAEKDILDGR